MEGAVDVLVIEDDKPVLRLMRWFLEDDGISVASAHDGAEAIEKVRHLRPRLVVLNTHDAEDVKRENIKALRREDEGVGIIDLWSPRGGDKKAPPGTGADLYLRAPLNGAAFLYHVTELLHPDRNIVRQQAERSTMG
jgi:two-component system, OmpR family, alkaline phosphatase synthesis response regulator PhoP